MKQYTISTLHRTLASVLLFSQLLTSCGGAEMIAPASTTPQTQQHMELSDDNPIPTSSIDSPAPLAAPDEQSDTSDASEHSFNSIPTYTTRQGHKIEFVQEGGQYVARVQEQLPPGFSSAPQILPFRFQKGFLPEDLTPYSYVDVVFPRHANGNKGYVFCAEHRGLLGGMPQKHPQCKYSGDQYTRNSNGDWVCPSGEHTVKNSASANNSASSSSGSAPRPYSQSSYTQQSSGVSFAQMRENLRNFHISSSQREFLDRQEREDRKREEEHLEQIAFERDLYQRNEEIKRRYEENQAISRDNAKALPSKDVELSDRINYIISQTRKLLAADSLKNYIDREIFKIIRILKREFQKERESYIREFSFDDSIYIGGGLPPVPDLKRRINKADLLKETTKQINCLEKLIKNLQELLKNKLPCFLYQDNVYIPIYEHNDPKEKAGIQELIDSYIKESMDNEGVFSKEERENRERQEREERENRERQERERKDGIREKGEEKTPEQERIGEIDRDLQWYYNKLEGLIKVAKESRFVPSELKHIHECVVSSLKELDRLGFSNELTSKCKSLVKESESLIAASQQKQETDQKEEQPSSTEHCNKSKQQSDADNKELVRIANEIKQITDKISRLQNQGSCLNSSSSTYAKDTKTLINEFAYYKGKLEKHDTALDNLTGLKEEQRNKRKELLKEINRLSDEIDSAIAALKAKQQQPSASSSSSKPPESSKEPEKPEEKPKTEVEQITEEVNEYLENHSKGSASKEEGGDLLTRTEALKKETKASYRRIDSLIDSDEPNAGLFMEQALQKKKDLNQLRGLRKQLKEACKFSKDELENYKVRLKPKEGEDGVQTDSSCEDGISREDWAFNKGALKGIGKGMIAAMKGSVEGLYHLATSPVATIEGFVEFLENIDELPGLLAASLEELEGMDPEQQGEAIAKFITEQVFTFYNPVSGSKVLQQVSKTKLGAAAVKVGSKTGDKLGKLARKYGLNYSSATTRQLLENFDMKATDWIGKYRKGNIKSVLKDVGDKTIGQIFDSADSQTRKLILDSRFAK